MSHSSKITPEDVEIALEKVRKRYGTPDPIGFLTEIMAGRDPRNVNELYALVLPSIEAKDYDLDRLFIKEILELIEKRYKYETLPDLDMSYKASVEVAKLYSKDGTVSTTADNVKLTPRDCKNFWKWFDKNYGSLAVE